MYKIIKQILSLTCN